MSWAQSCLFLRKHSLSWREESIGIHWNPTVRHKCKNHNSTNITKERYRGRLFRALKNDCCDCESSYDYSRALSFHHLDSSCAHSWPISSPTIFPRLHPHFEDSGFSTPSSPAWGASQLSQSEFLPSWPLNYLVARSRKIQPSSWFSNIFVLNSVHWPFSLGLGSRGLWVRENVLRILFRKRGRKKHSKYTHASTLKDTPATLVKRIGRRLVQKEGKWVKLRFKDEVQSNQRWASSWERNVRMVTRWILSFITIWIYEVLIFMPSKYSNGFLCQDY